MDLKQSKNSPVITDQVPLCKSRLGISSTMHLTIPRRKSLNGWLDAMKSSSPPCKMLGKDASFEAATEDANAAYCNWVSKHPSALASFEKITNFAKDKKIALFMDYDGTLSPIVGNPDHAFMSSAMRTTVKDVAKYFPTAIISGRNREKVYEFVGLKELYYAGSHGMDLVVPFRDSDSSDEQGNNVNLYQPASEFLPMIDEVFRSLIDKTKDINGSKIENNKFCVSVHYRLVDENSWTVIAQRVNDILKNYPRLELTYGRKVLEIRPIIDWNKGNAVEFLLESLGLNDGGSGAVLPIYIGDDLSDEDAFKVLSEGKRGYGILVSSVPKKTKAHFSLKDPSEVMVFLKSLVIWKMTQQAVHRSI